MNIHGDNKYLKREKKQMVKKNCGNILADGELTGHAHRVTVQVMEREDGVREFEGETTVTHEEHKPVKLPHLAWNSAKVNEYDYYAEMAREVRD
ncbi:hypothetical protein [Dehalococcoides sp.]|jgi:hypothetical protein|uniref:hypothetical protein n=1 Tax=Dehalococcoides sp. TaxID=1966486 RepID=UPI0035661381